MKIKSIVILFSVLLLLPGIIVLRKPSSRYLLSSRFIGTVSSVTMEYRGGSYTLIKRDKDWFLEEGNVLFICKIGIVDAFLEKLYGLKIIETAGSSKEVWGDLGVAENNHHSTTLKNGNEAVKLFWGKKSAGGREIFIRTNDEESVYVTSFPGNTIYTDRWDWVNLKIIPFDIDTSAIISLVFYRDGQKYSIIRKDFWELMFSQGTARLDSGKINLLLERIKNLKGEAARLKKDGDEMLPAGSLIINLAGNTTLSLIFLKDKKDNYFAAEKDGVYLYRINRAERNAVLPGLKYLLDHF